MLYIPPANLWYLLTVLFYFIFFKMHQSKLEHLDNFFSFIFFLNPGQSPNVMFPKVD